MTKTKSVYTLNNYLLKDSSLTGTGVVMENGSKRTFMGEIFFSDIDYVQMKRTRWGRPFWVVAGLTTFAILANSSIETSNSFIVNDVTKTETVGGPTYGGGEGSCPFVYSRSGSNDVLEGEAFATSWGKALEQTTGIMLPHLKEKSGQFSIRIANKRPETHYLNSVSITGIESDRDATVYFDPNNNAWPIHHPLPPISAVDGTGKDILPSVALFDGKYWGSIEQRSSAVSGYRDEIGLLFERPVTAREGTIVIRSINTSMFNAVLQTMSDVVGNDAVNFVDAVENDAEMISILRRWLDEASLKISQWNGNGWVEIGTIIPEANEASFTRVVRFSRNTGYDGPVRIKLSTLHDVWKFDAVQIDWTPSDPLTKRTIQLTRAVTENGENVMNNVSSADERYTVLLPSHSVECSFSAATTAKGKKMTYAAEIGGYLHEWFPQGEHNSNSLFSDKVSGPARLKLLKEFLNNRSLVLPVIYARWDAMNEKEERKVN
ncbi:MAG: hypothetical protein ACOYNS_07055 [Bacteroidota bacterium]